MAMAYYIGSPEGLVEAFTLKRATEGELFWGFLELPKEIELLATGRDRPCHLVRHAFVVRQRKAAYTGAERRAQRAEGRGSKDDHDRIEEMRFLTCSRTSIGILESSVLRCSRMEIVRWGSPHTERKQVGDTR